MIKKDVKNLFSLAIIQGSNALFPLLIFPYLYSILDRNVFSLMMITESIMLFLVAICLYSFDVTGVKYIVDSRDKNNHENQEESKIYWTIILIRSSIFLFISSILLLVYYFFIPIYFYILLIWMMFPLGMVMQANYYFQACENNNILGFIVLISRAFSCILIYLMVNKHTPLLVIISYLSGSYLLSGFLSMIYIIIGRKLKFSICTMKESLNMLRSGFSILIGNLSVALFRGSNTLILSIVSTVDAVSIYSLSEKFVKSIQALTRPLNQIAFPKLVRGLKGKNNSKEIKNTIWNNTKYQIIIMGLFIPLLLMLLYFANYYHLWDALELQVIILIGIMSMAILFGISNYMFGSIGLNVLGMSRYYALSIIATGFISVFISFHLCFLYAEIGAASSFVFGEVILFLFFYTKYFFLTKVK